MLVHRIIYFLPYVLVFLTIYLIDNIVNFRKKIGKLNIPLISIMSVAAVVLIIYYMPSDNILKSYNLDDMRIDVWEDDHQVIGAKLEDKARVKSILEIINKHTFIRSAARTIEQQNIADSQRIEVSGNFKDVTGIVRLYILKDNKKNSLLQVGNQVYNIKNNEEVIKEINELLEEFGLFDK